MNDATGNGMIAAVARTVTALTRSLGGRAVMLRMPAAAIAADDGEQLGLSVPLFQDVPLEPVVVRRVHATASGDAQWELAAGAEALQSLVGPLAYGSVKRLLQNVCGVVVGDLLMELVEVESAEAFGEVYLYRLQLREPAGA